jgi:exodeoxyribonuclease V gamma subunit
MTTSESASALREVDGRDLRRGLLVMRASRLEALIAPLVELLVATRPRNVLAPQTIVAAHPGMAQWLHGQLARAPGMGGIAANLDVTLPSSWIDDLARKTLDRKALSLPRYQQKHLRWTIHEVLASDFGAIGVTDARVATYLRGDADSIATADLARRRFQLADRLARIYTRYLVYRPDWLRAWETGSRNVASRAGSNAVLAATEADLLAPLWQHLHARLGAHRGDVVTELIERLDHADADEEDALHVFGLSHLAPSELAVLRAYARTRPVALYVPDPCREYWAGLGRDLDSLRGYRKDEEARIAAAGEKDYWVDQGHPLLARWGRMGQHFMLALSDGRGDVLEDVRHWQDEQAFVPSNRLERLQQSFRELKPDLLKVGAQAATAQSEIDDASLRIHVCHTRLRELEVLRDQLLDAMQSSAIKPSGIVVMAPDIQAYAALIPAVFGVPGDARERLPYHLSDIAIASSHSLFKAFTRLLELPAMRISAPEVVDLLGVAEISRRLGLDAAAVDMLSDWLRESRVAWALDAKFRERFGVPAIAEHTFAWAMDRLLAGYLMADAANSDRQPAVTLADGSELAPLTGIHGPAAEHLGALDQLLQEIQALCDLAERSLPASEWAQRLEARFDALFRIDAMDREAREASTCIRQFIRALGTEPGNAGEDPELHFSVVRDLLVERLSAAPERQRFLMGGITFCGMVPQRAIPFRLVAVLGLNDGEFPRQGSDAGLDLMGRYRRLGDRDVRSDDRYLFLETVMSARERLHLSYIGESVRDGKPRNPASPLAELMAALDQASGLAEDDADERPWLVQHPLQPFNRRYFDGEDPRLFSYDPRYAAMVGGGSEAAVPAFLDNSVTRDVDVGTSITLRELHDYYRDPARQVLARRMQIRLDALEDERLPQDEPIEARFEAWESIARKLFFEVLARRANGLADSLDEVPAWIRLSGRMPPGRAGEQAWENEKSACQALLAALDESAWFASAMPPLGSHEFDIVIDSLRLSGRIEQLVLGADQVEWRLLRVFPDSKTGKLKEEKSLTFKERIPLFLDWALLRLDTSRREAPLPGIRLSGLVKGKADWLGSFDRWDQALIDAEPARRLSMLDDLQQRVVALIAFWRDSQGRPHWYFPKASWEIVKDEAAAKIANKHIDEIPHGVGGTWIAGHQGGIGERDYSPGYARLLAGDVEFAADTPELAALASTARQLKAWISLDPEPEVQA